MPGGVLSAVQSLQAHEATERRSILEARAENRGLLALDGEREGARVSLWDVLCRWHQGSSPHLIRAGVWRDTCGHVRVARLRYATLRATGSPLFGNAARQHAGHDPQRSAAARRVALVCHPD